MKNRRSIKNPALALSSAALLAASVWLAVWSGGNRAGARSNTESPEYSFTWAEGQRYRYSLEARATERIVPAGKASSAEVEGESYVASELLVRSYGQQGENYLLGFEIADCRDAQVVVAGHTLASSSAECQTLFEGYELFAEVAPSGELKAVYDTESSEETRLASHFLHSLVTELQVVVRPGRTWSAMQASTKGRARNEYQRTAAPLVMTRHREEYEELRTLPMADDSEVEVRGDAQIVLAKPGYLGSFDGSESIRVEEAGLVVAESTSEVHLAFLGTMPASRKAPALALSSKRAVGEISNAQRMRTLMLEQRAGSMTQESLLGDMARYGAGGVMPNHAQFMWSVTGFLELHPEACEPFAELFGAAGASPKQRALIADVLAQVHHPMAQQALVGVLSTEVARSDPRFVRYFQSLAVTPTPTEESVAFATSQLARRDNSDLENDVNAATAAAFVLGGMRSHLGEADAAMAASIDESLLSVVEHAGDDASLAHAVRALGNSRAPNHVGVYEQYREHQSPTVRRSAARALGRAKSSRTTPLLLSLARDVNARVQGEAFDALQVRELDSSALVALGELAAGGEVHWHNHGRFVSLMEANAGRHPGAVMGAIEALLGAPNMQSPDARAAAYRLLEAVRR